MKNKIFTIFLSAFYPPIYIILFLLFIWIIPYLLIPKEAMNQLFVMPLLLCVGSSVTSGLTGMVLTNIYKGYDPEIILIIPFLFFLFLTMDTIIFNNIKQSLITDLLICLIGFGVFYHSAKDRQISKG